MLHMPNRIQSMPPKGHNSRSLNGSGSGVKFGLLTPERLDAYQDDFNKIPVMRKISSRDLIYIHDQVLSVEEQQELERVCDFIKPGTLSKMEKLGKLGVVNSASEMLLGLYTLTALSSGAISEGFIKKLSQQQLPVTKQPSTQEFQSLLQQLGDMLPNDKVKRFQQLVGGDPKEAKDLLAVIAMRAVLASSHDKQYTLKQDGRDSLSRGLAAFNGLLPWYSPRRMQTWLMVVTYKYIPKLPVEWFRSKLLEITIERLERNICYNDLMNVLQRNERFRQNVNYRQSQAGQFNRKHSILPVQMLYEAAIVKNAAAWHLDNPI